MKRHFLFFIAIALAMSGCSNDLKPMKIPESNISSNTPTELATFGGGCFWCMEAVFETLYGVKAVTSGYAGGTKENPTYREVCEHTTGHAEVVQIEFDPKKISYDDLLGLFWESHDPTSLNRQGADAGPQYRSIILYQNDAQKAAAEKAKQTAQKDFSKPIVTEIVPLKKFYSAEDYHQDYFRNNPNQGYCSAVIRPKVAHLQEKIEALNKKLIAKKTE